MMEGNMVISGKMILWRQGAGCTDASDLRWSTFPAKFDLVSHKSGIQITLVRVSTKIEDGELELAVYRGLARGRSIVVTVFNDVERRLKASAAA